MKVQTIKEEIQKWDKSQQADLMHFLVELLSNDKFQFSEEWNNELDKRLDALNNGTSIGHSAREVLAKYTAL